MNFSTSFEILHPWPSLFWVPCHRSATSCCSLWLYNMLNFPPPAPSPYSSLSLSFCAFHSHITWLPGCPCWTGHFQIPFSTEPSQWPAHQLWSDSCFCSIRDAGLLGLGSLFHDEGSITGGQWPHHLPQPSSSSTEVVESQSTVPQPPGTGGSAWFLCFFQCGARGRSHQNPEV